MCLCINCHSSHVLAVISAGTVFLSWQASSCVCVCVRAHACVVVCVSCVCVCMCVHPLPSLIDSAVQRCEEGSGASSRKGGPTGSKEVVGSLEKEDSGADKSDNESMDDGDSDSDNDSDTEVAAEQFGSDLESSDEDTVVDKNDTHLDRDRVKDPAATSLTTPHIPYTFEGERGWQVPGVEQPIWWCAKSLLSSAVPESVADLQALLSNRYSLLSHVLCISIPGPPHPLPRPLTA